MNDSEPIWYFSVAGQQQGPVTLAELKSKAAGGALNPRHDLVWKQGMKDWQPAGEVEGIFERRAVAETPPALSPAAATPASPDPYAPPETDGTDAEALQHANWPGARRRSYILMAIVVPILWQIGVMVAVPLMAIDPGITALAVFGTMLFVVVFAIWFGLQRLTNVGMSRWWYLGNLVPFLNLWIGFRMLACPAGYAYHKKLDGAGIALAILYWGLILLSLLVAVGVILIIGGAMGSPELQRQIEQFVRELEQSSSR